MPTNKISYRCENYPACFIDDSASDMLPGCLLCGYRPQDNKDLIDHIRVEHPIKDVECFKCRVHTRVEGSKYCSYCIDETEAEAEREMAVEEERRPVKSVEVVEVKKQNKCRYCGRSCRGKTCSDPECQRKYSEEWYAKNRKKKGGKKSLKASKSVVPKKAHKLRKESAVPRLKPPVIEGKIDIELITLQQILVFFNSLSQAGKDYLRMRLFDG